MDQILNKELISVVYTNALVIGLTPKYVSWSVYDGKPGWEGEP